MARRPGPLISSRTGASGTEDAETASVAAPKAMRDTEAMRTQKGRAHDYVATFTYPEPIPRKIMAATARMIACPNATITTFLIDVSFSATL